MPPQVVEEDIRQTLRDQAPKDGDSNTGGYLSSFNLKFWLEWFKLKPDMRNSGIFETKTHFSQLIEEVMAGESISITRHGHEVARLVPPEFGVAPAHSARMAIEGIHALRKQLSDKNPEPDNMSIREMIAWGRE